MFTAWLKVSWLLSVGLVIASACLISSVAAAAQASEVGPKHRHVIIVTPQDVGNAINFTIHGSPGQPPLSAQVGLAMPNVVGAAASCEPDTGYYSCFAYFDYARLQLRDDGDRCTQFRWTSTFARKLEDCFDIEAGVHWYGGGEENWFQPWPIEGVVRGEEPMVSGGEWGSVVENYWLLSNGVAIHAEEDVPLFTRWEEGRVCLSAQDKYPYKTRDFLHLTYSICTGTDVKDVHLRTLRKFYDVPPVEAPDRTMILRPFWSTWAQYHREVNQSLVIEYAQRLRAEGFDLNSHLEVDDDWETCYGEAQFNEEKFPNVTGMVQTLNELGLKVTLWMHPFINFECPAFATAIEHRYFVSAPNGKPPGLISWWMGDVAGFIDYTNPEAVAWWTSRLEAIKQRYGIVSFKFDVGETSWLPAAYNLTGDESLFPNLVTTSYVKTVAGFGDMVEVGAARRSQREAIFTRMLDKDSSWGYERGLRSLIPSVLQFGILGYPFALPDMIGGNAYSEPPSKELYVRWMQVNTFMPAVQFSIVPWDFDAEVVQICKDMLALRERHADLIYKAVDEALIDGSPISRPMWWEDPIDEVTFTIDDQYILGGDIIVAPVLDEGSTARDVYLPRGMWFGENGVVYDGPLRIENYPAPLNTLPYFVKIPTTSTTTTSTTTTPLETTTSGASWGLRSNDSVGFTISLIVILLFVAVA